MRWKEVERQREVGRREDSQAFDQNIGDSLIFGKVRVELVSAEERREVSTLSPPSFIRMK
jgi:hypothetical protein